MNDFYYFSCNLMTDTTAYSNNTRPWHKWLWFTLRVVTLIGFLPWERMLPIQVMSDSLVYVIDGTLAIWGMFLLLCMGGFVLWDKARGWLKILATLLIPIILFLALFATFASMIFSGPAWKDQVTYISDNNCLIVQGILYGRDDIDMDYRIVRTTTPEAPIRWLEEMRELKANDHTFDMVASSVTYQGKVWHKVNNFEP